MEYWDKSSKLASKTIRKVWLNKKDYKFLDFKFKVKNLESISWSGDNEFDMEIYNHDVLILRMRVGERTNLKEDRRFDFKVTYFNPQTDNDCFSINHIIAVSSEYLSEREQLKDMGNAEIINNQFIFRKKGSYYSYVKVWVRGEIKDDNYDRMLSYEFATDEYINFVKRIFSIKKMQRRTIKKEFKRYLDRILLLEGLKKL